MDGPKLNKTLNEYGERLQKIVCVVADKAGISMEEAASRISNALQTITESLKSAFEEVGKTFEQLRKSGIFNHGNVSSARRRKAERSRARTIEQVYHEKIRLFERQRPFRRVYKPP